MKRFENVLFVPSGFVREIKPVSNSELDNLSVELMNKTTVKPIEVGAVEICSEEISKVSNPEFVFTETFYKILIPMSTNISAETNSRMSMNGYGWERIRNVVVENTMKFDSTVKLWEATRKNSALFQKLPHTIYYEDNDQHYFKLRRLGLPYSLKSARREYRKESQILHGDRARPHLENWDFNRHMRGRLDRMLKLASNILPRSATHSNNLGKNVRHSLKTELLRNIEIDCSSMGLRTKSEDKSFNETIRRFQEPTETNLPLTFTTCYKTSVYTNCPETLEPATMWDVSDGKNIIKANAGVSFDFIVQTLTSAWLRKFDFMHNFSHETPIKTLLTKNEDLEKTKVNKSNSKWARKIRGDEISLDENDYFPWSGRRNFNEARLDATGLRIRKDALSHEIID